MRGHTNKHRQLLAATETSLARIVGAINRLPFGFVGWTFKRTGTYTPLAAMTWEPVSFSAILDDDKMLTAAATGARINEGCDGVFVLGFLGRTVTSIGEFRVRDVATSTVLHTVTLDTVLQSSQSAPLKLSVGQTVVFEYRAALGVLLEAGCTVSTHRLGLLP
jgi:hypothetical protein